MKFLAIGIDDADPKIINKMDMPFMQNLMTSGECVNIEEDIFSRGWSEFFTGKHARDTKAFYDYPLLSKNYNTSQNFGINMLPDSIIPIWKLISDRGYKVGIMNVPTTMPAKKINGFFVAGAGGGLNKLQKTQKSLCYPLDVLSFLQDRSYIVDLRLTTSGINDITDFFQQFMNMAKKRSETFIDLCKFYKTDFSFIVFRSLAIVQYLGMSEIEFLYGSDYEPNGDSKASNSIYFRKKLIDFYHFFDDLINNLVTELQPKNILVFSDHGKVPYIYNINCNSFLQNIGLQQSNKLLSNSLYYSIVKNTPHGIKNLFKAKRPETYDKLSVSFDYKKTKAFSLGLINGIYINDAKRFSGPIIREKQVKETVDLICKEFNDSEEAKKFNLHAIPYRQQFIGSRYADCLPDVWIDKPDIIRPYGKGKFIEKNYHYEHICNLNTVYDDNWTGIKGKHPLFFLNRESLNYLDNHKTDLTLGYQLLDNIFK